MSLEDILNELRTCIGLTPPPCKCCCCSVASESLPSLNFSVPGDYTSRARGVQSNRIALASGFVRICWFPFFFSGRDASVANTEGIIALYLFMRAFVYHFFQSGHFSPTYSLAFMMLFPVRLM
jgi:hypothetical protein